MGVKQGGYIKEIIGGEHFDMMPRSIGGIASSSTGYCDQHWYNANGRLLFVGGNANNGTNDGLAYVNSDNTPSNTNANIGSRHLLPLWVSKEIC